MRHRKFIKLARLLKSEALARGHLEIIWDAAYEAGDPLLGTAEDVEFLARWSGNATELATALRESGFLDCDDTGAFRVHDLFDHAPNYVHSRVAREGERKTPKLCQWCGCDYRSTDAKSKYCSDKCRNKEWKATNGNAEQRTATEEQRCGETNATHGNDTPALALARARAPAPNKEVAFLFEQFWALYPKRRRQAKGAARAAWFKAVSETTPEVLLSAVREYAESYIGKSDYVKSPLAWLEGQCWLDERDAWKENDKSAGFGTVEDQTKRIQEGKVPNANGKLAAH